MRATLDPTLHHLRVHEGGYVDHPNDPGGCTNLGITIGTYRKLVDPSGDCASLRQLLWVTARDIYANTYWSAVNGDALPPGLDLVVCDHGVNAGPKRAARMLQRLLGVGQDGVIGPITADAAWSLGSAGVYSLIQTFTRARLDYYRGLSTWPTFGRGWTNRAEGAQKAALAQATAQGAVWIDVDDLPSIQPSVQPSTGPAPTNPDIARANLLRHLQNAFRKLPQIDLRDAGPVAEAAKDLQALIVERPDAILGPATWQALARHTIAMVANEHDLAKNE